MCCVYWFVDWWCVVGEFDGLKYVWMYLYCYCVILLFEGWCWNG